MTRPARAAARSRPARLDDLNALLLDPDTRVVNDLLEVVARYGTPEEINRKARAAGQLPALLERVRGDPPRVPGRPGVARRSSATAGAFVSVADYRRGVLGDRAAGMAFRDDMAVTLEVSALQYFPWVIAAARQAIAERSLMPGRLIQVRKMKEQEADGDLPAIAAAMQIIGASYVETLDTKGTDGSNVHLGGPATITGYFGGIGQPNDHPLQWVDEFLYYYTNYGVRQVLNINPGTVLVGYLLHRLGVDIEFKISVFMGNDNPYAALWTLIGGQALRPRRRHVAADRLQLEQLGQQRDAWRSPPSSARRSASRTSSASSTTSPRRGRASCASPTTAATSWCALADHVPNISAKHEGGDPEVDAGARPPLRHPRLLPRRRRRSSPAATGTRSQLNFLDKLDATNHTARALTEHGLSFVAAAQPAPLGRGAAGSPARARGREVRRWVRRGAASPRRPAERQLGDPPPTRRWVLHVSNWNVATNMSARDVDDSQTTDGL